MKDGTDQDERDLQYFNNTGDPAAFERLCDCWAREHPDNISLGLRNPLEILIKLEIEFTFTEEE